MIFIPNSLNGSRHNAAYTNANMDNVRVLDLLCFNCEEIIESKVDKAFSVQKGLDTYSPCFCKTCKKHVGTLKETR